MRAGRGRREGAIRILTMVAVVVVAVKAGVGAEMVGVAVSGAVVARVVVWAAGGGGGWMAAGVGRVLRAGAAVVGVGAVAAAPGPGSGREGRSLRGSES